MSSEDRCGRDRDRCGGANAESIGVARFARILAAMLAKNFDATEHAHSAAITRKTMCTCAAALLAVASIDLMRADVHAALPGDTLLVSRIQWLALDTLEGGQTVDAWALTEQAQMRC